MSNARRFPGVIPFSATELAEMDSQGVTIIDRTAVKHAANIRSLVIVEIRKISVGGKLYVLNIWAYWTDPSVVVRTTVAA